MVVAGASITDHRHLFSSRHPFVASEEEDLRIMFLCSCWEDWVAAAMQRDRRR